MICPDSENVPDCGDPGDRGNGSAAVSASDSGLSAQTGFPSYFTMTIQRNGKIRAEWEKMDVHFDGIYTGFAGNEAQIGQMLRFLDTFYKKGAFLLVDPIMEMRGKYFRSSLPNCLRV